jgi:hypothetical protein
MKCPQCDSEAAKVGAFWVCPVHGQLPEPQAFAPMRIFLSYGHDSNEELVRRLKEDLERRGHDVWFDKSEIKFGDDWRRTITDGILQSNRVLSFLSKHSARDPGVCRDEIAIAIGVKGGNIQTILVESEQEVQPPVNIGHIQRLDMHDWKEQRAAGEAAWEPWYQAKLSEIVGAVESEEKVFETIDLSKELETELHEIVRLSKRATVFLSYSMKNSLTAESIRRTLMAHGFMVPSPDDFGALDQSYQDILSKVITDASTRGFVLVLLSPASLASQFVKYEAERALDIAARSQRSNVIPVIIQPFLPDALPPQLANIQWFNLTTGPFEERFEELIRSLKTREME